MPGSTEVRSWSEKLSGVSQTPFPIFRGQGCAILLVLHNQCLREGTFDPSSGSLAPAWLGPHSVAPGASWGSSVNAAPTIVPPSGPQRLSYLRGGLLRVRSVEAPADWKVLVAGLRSAPGV